MKVSHTKGKMTDQTCLLVHASSCLSPVANFQTLETENQTTKSESCGDHALTKKKKKAANKK